MYVGIYGNRFSCVIGFINIFVRSVSTMFLHTGKSVARTDESCKIQSRRSCVKATTVIFIFHQ